MESGFPTIADFKVVYRQFLNENGELVHDLPSFAIPETLRFLYKEMLLVRTFDTKAINLQRTGKMGTYPSILGQEAVSVAIGHAMKKEDVLVPYYRDQGAQLQRGTSMADIFRYWGGDERGSDFRHAREDFPICVPIATQCLHATGIARAFQYRKQARVAVSTIGEGGTSKGDFYEALNLAGVWNLPVVFVVNNNQWAISVPRASQTGAQTIAQKAIAGGFTGIQVDGNDVIAMRQTMTEALEKARSGHGPTLIEAMTYRLGDHTTADDASRYRNKEELALAWEKEPLRRLRNYLIAQQLWSDEEEEKLIADSQREVAQAVEDYVQTPRQTLNDLFDYTYEIMTPPLLEQKDYAHRFKEKAHHD
ncbi:MAG: pyruvate dehydrogenase (acetyl-transferring) E1 component subunit alpha [Gammaproteobacteria bacterium]|nr:pyruvate dehydrogenase (acetyl-transferring) E1 component subunit alpha [Gammaproteobacteria bacterium]